MYKTWFSNVCFKSFSHFVMTASGRWFNGLIEMRFTEGLIKKKHLNNLSVVRNKLRDHTFMIIVDSIVFNFFFEK